MQRKTLKYLIIILVCWMAALPVPSQTSIIYSTDNQISSSLINDIYQDHKGFIWIATEYGLNMFDGNKYTCYYHIDNDSTSLLDNYIHSLFEDREGNFWICSLGGLMKYDYKTNTFSERPLYNKSARVHPHIRQVIESKNGDIWIASSGEGAFKISRGEQKGIRVEDLDKPDFIYLSSILEDDSGNIWLGAENNGLLCYNPTTRQSKLFQKPFISENNISVLTKDDAGNIYIGTLKGGVNVYNPQTSQITQLPYHGRFDLQIKTLSFIQNNLYIGTDGEGLKIYTPGSKEIQDKDLEDLTININNAKIHSILIDRENNLWLGLFQRGIVFAPQKKNPFQYYGYKSLRNSPIGNSCVMSLLQDNDGRLYVGTDNEGLYILDKDYRQIKHFTPGKGIQDIANTVLSIFQDSDKELWLGTYTKGAARCNPQTGICDFIPEMSNERVFSITEDKDKRLYFSTYGSGFYVYDKKNQTIKCYEAQERNDDKPGVDELLNGWINSLYCDKEGLIWIGHFKGISCFNPQTQSFINFTNKNYIIGNCIGYAIIEAKDGTIWAGTSNGLYSFNKQTKEIKRYTQENGLSNNVVCGICEDNLNNIWVSTFHGISCLDLSKNSFTTYYSSDGLQGNEFTRGAFFRSPEGEIFFGGVNGITSFVPEKITISPQKPEILITDFIVSGKSINTNSLSGGEHITRQAVTESDRFRLGHRDNTFSISFSTLQFADTPQIIYKYHIKELETEWQQTAPGINTVTYNNLRPGHYTFQVYALNHGQSSEIKNIHIIITPPWFQSWWAYLIYLLAGLSVAGVIISFIRSRLDQRREKLERQHAEALNEAKLQFFINISHEIRTPMTLIINPLEKLIQNCKDSELGKTYMMIYRNSQRILRLINQLMDIRKIDKGQMHLKFRETDMVGFIEDLVTAFGFIAEKKHITLEFNHTEEHLKAWIDLNNFDKVVMNLLSNAFKYTPEGGTVTITLSTGESEEYKMPLRKYIEIKVADTGIGLDDSQIERIFDRFYQINNDITRNQAGTGVGLHLTRSLVELHHGIIIARNRKDVQGSEFIVRIPAGGNHLMLEEMEQPTEFENKNQFLQKYKQSELESLEGNEKEEGKKVKAKSNLHILVVDDEKEILEYLKNELSSEYKVQTCNNGREAYEYILNNHVDLVVSDVMMPEMDGFTLCKKIKQNANINHIPVILLTAKGRAEEQLEGIGLGADSYLVKPFHIEMLQGIITNLINNRRLLKNKFSGAQEQADKVQKIQLKSSDEVLMNKIMKIINDNLSEPSLSVEMLANEVGLSRVHLHRKLKELTNLSSRDFIRNIRMQQAAKLLKEKKLSISEVAYAVGYNNLSHFSNTFKEYFGMSPKEYMQANLTDHKEENETNGTSD